MGSRILSDFESGNAASGSVLVEGLMNLNKSGVDEPDRELFVRLIMRHDRPIRAFLRGLLPTAADVDEVMQEVSVIAWRKFGQLDDPNDFRRWVCVIARYEVLMYRRKKARDRLVLGEEIEQLIAEEGLQELDLREQQLKALDHCIAKLPRERRELALAAYATERAERA